MQILWMCHGLNASHRLEQMLVLFGGVALLFKYVARGRLRGSEDYGHVQFVLGLLLTLEGVKSQLRVLLARLPSP